MPSEARRCKNCGVSTELDAQRGYKRCNACHMYLYRTGQERPPHLYKRFAAWHTTQEIDRRSSI